MSYYIKQGQSSILTKIKILGNECQISNISTNEKKLEKIVKKLKKKNINQVVLSKQLKENKEFIEQLNNYDITIFDGKWLMQYMLQDIIKYLAKKQKILEKDEIAILANDLTNEVKENIKIFTNTYKKIRIVTNHIDKFKRIEEFYQEEGIPIIISNNKRKALTKSKLIINFDFVQETINQYNINENAIIINLNDNIKINKKRFCGTIITDYAVKLQNANENNEEQVLQDIQDIVKKQTEFDLKEILEEKIYSKVEKQANFNMFRTIEEVIKKYQIQITQLYGINGIIS